MDITGKRKLAFAIRKSMSSRIKILNLTDTDKRKTDTVCFRLNLQALKISPLCHDCGRSISPAALFSTFWLSNGMGKLQMCLYS